MNAQHLLTPYDAIRRAFWTVKVPSLAILFLTMGTYVVLAKMNHVPSNGYAGMKWFLLIFTLAFAGSWLFWSIQIPRWRLWAYRHVGDIDLLKELAVEHQYIWPAGSVFEKTEIMSKSVRDELRALEARSWPGI